MKHRLLLALWGSVSCSQSVLCCSESVVLWIIEGHIPTVLWIYDQPSVPSMTIYECNLGTDTAPKRKNVWIKINRGSTACKAGIISHKKTLAVSAKDTVHERRMCFLWSWFCQTWINVLSMCELVEARCCSLWAFACVCGVSASARERWRWNWGNAKEQSQTRWLRKWNNIMRQRECLWYAGRRRLFKHLLMILQMCVGDREGRVSL